MAVPFSNTKLRVPKGFQNILECLAREVLRSQPDNINEFAAIFFEKMLKVRSETGHDPAIHGAKLEDRNYNNESFKKRAVDPSDPQQTQAAVAIQTQFRQHSAKEEVGAMREEQAAMRIQAGLRGHMDREHVRNLKSQKQDGGEEEVDIDLKDPEVEKAAIKIQAGFKGFKARKEVQELSEGATKHEEQEAANEPLPPSAQAPGPPEKQVDIDLTDPEVEKAAVKIQAGFKGFKMRKAITDKQAQEESSQPAGADGAQAQQADTQAAEKEEEEKEVDVDRENPATETAALTPRKDLKQPTEGQDDTQTTAADDIDVSQQQESQGKAEAEAGEEQKTTEAEEGVDIDLTDPEVAKAATRIQAGFKGFKARKDVQDMKRGQPSSEGVKDGEGIDHVDATPDAVEEESASAQLVQEETAEGVISEQPQFPAAGVEAEGGEQEGENAPASGGEGRD